VEYKLNIVSPGFGQKLIGQGYVLKSGKTLTTCRTDIYVINHQEKKLCATSLNTLIALQK
jgi:acyl-coenzyme A thioesterase PaaI-like protein